MDSLTQIVLGAAMGEVALGKKAGNKAQLYGAIAGTVPDLDVAARFVTDTVTATQMHRGFSHSILFALIASPILGYMVNKIERRLNLGWHSWTSLFFLGIFTHPLLDAFTTWGTQIFWPLDHRVAFNTIFVVDPLYTLPFLFCTVWAMFKKRGTLSRKRINRTGIAISSCYLVFTVALKQFTTSKFIKALTDQNIAYEQISTRPGAFNTILWNANVDTGDTYLLGDYSIFDTQPITFKSYPKNRKDEVILDNPNAAEDINRLIDISQGWYLLEPRGDEWYFHDLRFGTIPLPDGVDQFVFSYRIYNQDGAWHIEEVEKKPENGKLLLQKLWKRIKGN
ncbi:MAG: metal-dependent hydrolase [Nonlabens sp.]